MSSSGTYPHSEPMGQATPSSTSPADTYTEEGAGWLAFAGIMLAIVGIMNVVYGIAAVDSANFYVANAQYVISDLNTWGWIMMGIGAIQFTAAFSIFGGTSWGRWIGIASASANAIFQLLFIPSYPFLALALFAVDVLIIYGLAAHGGHRAEMR